MLDSNNTEMHEVSTIDDKDRLAIYIINGILGASIIGVVVFVVILILTGPALNQAFDYSGTGQIGDTIGGISAPFIGIAGVVLTFLAFYIQYKANQIQFKQFSVQRREKTREYHESKILYLIQQNREIVESMAMSDTLSGVKCMANMYEEFRVAYLVVRRTLGKKLKLSREEIINIAYVIFFNGVSGVSGRLNTQLLVHVQDLQPLLFLFRKLRDNAFTEKLDGIIEEYNLPKAIKRPLSKMEYTPFEGHMVRLGQYFRNLFHLLNYTTSLSKSLFNDDEKYEIIKSLRSQMSSYEQIIIYFNSLSFYGKPMRDARFINTYWLIKNIPLPLVSFAGDMRERYPDIKFEWDEVLDRAGIKPDDKDNDKLIEAATA